MELSGQYIKGTGDFEIKEFSAQDSVLKELDKGKQFWECQSAGTFAEIQPYAYGSGRFWLYKGGDSNTSRVNFISDRIAATVADYNGYSITFGGTENVILRENSTVGQANLFATAASYIAINTWYEIEWDRTLDGEFTIRIRGGAFGENFVLVDVSGGSGSNPVTDNTFTESVYQVLDLDVGDRYIPGIKKKAVRVVSEVVVVAGILDDDANGGVFYDDVAKAVA